MLESLNAEALLPCYGGLCYYLVSFHVAPDSVKQQCHEPIKGISFKLHYNFSYLYAYGFMHTDFNLCFPPGWEVWFVGGADSQVKGGWSSYPSRLSSS